MSEITVRTPKSYKANEDEIKYGHIQWILSTPEFRSRKEAALKAERKKERLRSFARTIVTAVVTLAIAAVAILLINYVI